jgi:hypothetical protein
MLSKTRNLNIVKFPERRIYIKAYLLQCMLGGGTTQRIYFSAWVDTAMPCTVDPPDYPTPSVFGKQFKVKK